MKRSLWIIYGLLAMLAAVALSRSADKEDVVASSGTPQPALPEVTVREEFITVSIPIAPAADRRHASRQRSPAATARPAPAVDAPPAARPDSRGDGLFDRARRAFVGDGRYRPEPFPRVKDDS